MNLARVLFKKHQHHHPHQQQRASSPDDRAPVDCKASSCLSPTASDDAASDEAGETTRSPRRKTRSTTGGKGSVKSSDVLPRPPHTTVVFKAIKTSLHRRFAQVLPNLLLGTLRFSDLSLTFARRLYSSISNVMKERLRIGTMRHYIFSEVMEVSNLSASCKQEYY